jgi:hypothetical protein
MPVVDKTLTPADLMELLERVEYINVAELCEPEQNALRLIVEEMTLNRASRAKLPPPLDDAIPVEHQSNDLCFEITWDRYNVYQVLSESFDSGNGPEEVYEGNLFRKYTTSRYLRFVGEAFKNVQFLDPGHQHWAIVGQNHIVDVISSAEPLIRVLREK